MCLNSLWKSPRGKRIDGIGFKEFYLTEDGHRLRGSILGAGPFQIGRWYTARVRRHRPTLVADRGGLYPTGFHVWLEKPTRELCGQVYRVAYREILAHGPNPGPTVVVKQIKILGEAGK